MIVAGCVLRTLRLTACEELRNFAEVGGLSSSPFVIEVQPVDERSHVEVARAEKLNGQVARLEIVLPRRIRGGGYPKILVIAPV